MTESSGGAGAGALDRPPTVPLTGMQKARLHANCVPFDFFVLLIAVYLLVSLTVWRSLIGPPKPLLLLFLGVVLLITGREGVQFRDRFHCEALAVAQLRHPNIFRVYDYGEEHGTSLLVTNFGFLPPENWLP